MMKRIVIACVAYLAIFCLVALATQTSFAKEIVTLVSPEPDEGPVTTQEWIDEAEKDPFYRQVFPVRYGPVPSLVMITNPINEKNVRTSRGTGYYASDDNEIVVFSAMHVIKGEDLILWNDDFRIHGNFSYDCERVKGWDGSCKIYQSDTASANIVRDVSRVPEEVSVFNEELQMWMPFRVVRTYDYGFMAVGLKVDITVDGVADHRSYVCHGMSGSPVVESQEGVPILDGNGRLISRGELDAMFSDEVECGSRIMVLNPEVD